jgi:hypothetical protein
MLEMYGISSMLFVLLNKVKESTLQEFILPSEAVFKNSIIENYQWNPD